MYIYKIMNDFHRSLVCVHTISRFTILLKIQVHTKKHLNEMYISHITHTLHRAFFFSSFFFFISLQIKIKPFFSLLATCSYILRNIKINKTCFYLAAGIYQSGFTNRLLLKFNYKIFYY